MHVGEVVVAQLVEQSLPIPEVRGSNPVISKNLYRTFTVNCIENTKIKKKRPGTAHFYKKEHMYVNAQRRVDKTKHYLYRMFEFLFGSK